MKPAEKNEFSGNFSYTDNFECCKDANKSCEAKKKAKTPKNGTVNKTCCTNKAGLKDLNPRWMFLRDFVDCYQVKDGKLEFNLLPGNIYKREPMSAIWARQQHGTFTAETEINFTPRNDKEIAGIALLQKEDHNFVLGKTMKKGKLMILKIIQKMQRKTRERIHTGFSAAKLRFYLKSFIVKCNQEFFLRFI